MGSCSSLQMAAYTAMVIVRFMALPVLKPHTGFGLTDDQVHAAPSAARCTHPTNIYVSGEYNKIDAEETASVAQVLASTCFKLQQIWYLDSAPTPQRCHLE